LILPEAALPIALLVREAVVGAGFFVDHVDVRALEALLALTDAGVGLLTRAHPFGMLAAPALDVEKRRRGWVVGGHH
jgi:hypothetical protein